MGLTKIIDWKTYVYFAPIATPLLQLTGVKTVPKLSSGLPPPKCAEVSPNLTPFTPVVSLPGAQIT